MEPSILWKKIEEAQEKHIRHLELKDEDDSILQIDVPLPDWLGEGKS